MVPPIESLIRELEAEAASTRRLLERVPAERLGWRPHPKSFTLGELALHIAQIPGTVGRMLAREHMEVGGAGPAWKSPESVDELLSVLAESITSAREWLSGLDETAALATWRVTRGETELFSGPRIAFIRSIMFNHLYHHRGELVVYLRLLDVPVPAVYGSSADDNPLRG